MYKIKLAEPDLTQLEKKYLNQAFESTFISSAGKFIERFENKFANYCKTNFATSTMNGTTALHLILEAIGIEGKEVILPNFTYVASASSVKHARGKPVLVDCGEDWNIDPNEVKKAITPKTKAIMAVHLYGQPALMNELKEIAQSKDLMLIEDCAEALGAEFNGKKVGSIGDAGAFSFFGNKVLTTGEGGMVTTNNEELHEKMLVLKNHGTAKKKYWHEVVGYNYRMTNLQAAVGLGQIERIEEIQKKRDEIRKIYDNNLDKKIFGIQKEYPQRKRICWLYPLLASTSEHKKMVMDSMEKNSIETREFFYPLHQMKPYLQEGNFKNSENFSERGIILPCHTKLTEKEVKLICKIANECK